MKDPAFLFYSTDFYEGTRTMTPQERACLVDLMIYQHQKGIIPNNLDRLQLYCTGIPKATLEATLKAKFKLTDKGWINNRLEKIIQNRQNFSEKQSKNGKIGQFLKKSKAFLGKKEYQSLFDLINSVPIDERYSLIIQYETEKEGDLQAMLQAMLEHLGNRNGNENENRNGNRNIKKGGVGEKIDFQNIIEKFNQKCPKLPQVIKLSQERKSKINARYQEHGLAGIFRVISQTAESKFLQGENDRGWTADFDWVFSPSNFLKILEGRYENRNGQTKEKPSRIDSIMNKEKEIQHGNFN